MFPLKIAPNCSETDAIEHGVVYDAALSIVTLVASTIATPNIILPLDDIERNNDDDTDITAFPTSHILYQLKDKTIQVLVLKLFVSDLFPVKLFCKVMLY